MYRLLRPLMFRLDAETAHDAVFALGDQLDRSAAVCDWLGRRLAAPRPRLSRHLADMRFGVPMGTAAGFDKNARLLHLIPALGFGFQEIGSVTARASDGNPKPRSFRLPADQALINRMGLNNLGAAAVSARLKGAASAVPLGINIAKTHDPAILGDAAIRDYVFSARTLAPFGDYLALNVSCPNTEEGKTFEDPAAFRDLLQAVTTELGPLAHPLFVKLSADLTDSEADTLCAIASGFGVDGYILVNTSLDRSGLNTPAGRLAGIGRGGLSGAPLASKSRRLIARLRAQLPPDALVIAVGGIRTTDDVLDRLRLGADLVQVYTGLVYDGPLWAARTAVELDARLEAEGTTLDEWIRAVR